MYVAAGAELQEVTALLNSKQSPVSTSTPLNYLIFFPLGPQLDSLPTTASLVCARGIFYHRWLLDCNQPRDEVQLERPQLKPQLQCFSDSVGCDKIKI